MADIEGGAGASPRLVERKAEMRRLRSVVEGAAAGAGALLVIEGPAGIGKSRLLSEACGQAEHAGLQVLRARGGVLERDLAYGAVRLLLERPLAALSAFEREAVLGGAAGLAAPALAARGFTGLQGPRGVVTPQVATDDSENIPAGNVDTQIVSKVVPAGTYVVHAKTQLSSISIQRIECVLMNGATAVDGAQWTSPAANSKTPASMLAVATVTTGPLRVLCAHQGPANTPGGSASETKLIAIPVG